MRRDPKGGVGSILLIQLGSILADEDQNNQTPRLGMKIPSCSQGNQTLRLDHLLGRSLLQC